MNIKKIIILLMIFSFNLHGEDNEKLNIDLNILNSLKVWEQEPMNFGKLMIGSKGPFLAKAILKAEGQKNHCFKIYVPNRVIINKAGSSSYMQINIDRNSGEGILEEETIGEIGKRSMAFEGRIDTLANESGTYRAVIPITIIYE